MQSRLTQKHILGIEYLTIQDMNHILDLADHIANHMRQDKALAPILQHKTIVNLFYENSTRTRASFELAAQKLGANVISISPSGSSVKKGETLIDTALTLEAMRADAFIVRHDESGAVALLADKVSNASFINAGDGMHEHPTQALLDALTIRRHKGRITRLTVAICGDILHSRVARSNILLLNAMGARVKLIAPPTLLPPFIEMFGVEIYHNMTEGLQDCDIVMMLRLQEERMQGIFMPSIREYYHFFGLNEEKMSYAKPDALIMHPGPMNRGVEISSSLADMKERSVILEQVEMGVAIRMACLSLLLSKTAPMSEDSV
jgi:aspartate carbamoyltransferase catalytic subunit